MHPKVLTVVSIIDNTDRRINGGKITVKMNGYVFFNMRELGKNDLSILGCTSSVSVNCPQRSGAKIGSRFSFFFFLHGGEGGGVGNRRVPKCARPAVSKLIGCF